MRHGTTVWNEKGISQGRTNNRLSQSGKDLTQEVAFKYKDTQFDVIFTSPLMRTMQTANIMNQYHNVKIIKDERLIEIDQGYFAGKKYLSLSETEKKMKSARDKNYGMEQYQSVFDRVENFINELKQYKTYDNVLIITHNVTASLMADILEGVDVDFNNKNHFKYFKNAEIKCFDLEC